MSSRISRPSFSLLYSSILFIARGVDEQRVCHLVNLQYLNKFSALDALIEINMLTNHSRAAHKFGRRRKNEIIARELTNKPAAATKLGWSGKSPSVIGALVVVYAVWRLANILNCASR